MSDGDAVQRTAVDSIGQLVIEFSGASPGVIGRNGDERVEIGI